MDFCQKFCYEQKISQLILSLSERKCKMYRVQENKDFSCHFGPVKIYKPLFKLCTFIFPIQTGLFFLIQAGSPEAHGSTSGMTRYGGAILDRIQVRQNKSFQSSRHIRISRNWP